MAWQMEVTQYNIIALTPAGFLETRSLSPRSAARRDPDRFLDLFARMAPIAQRLLNQRAQLALQLDCQPQANEPA